MKTFLTYTPALALSIFFTFFLYAPSITSPIYPSYYYSLEYFVFFFFLLIYCFGYSLLILKSKQYSKLLIPLIGIYLLTLLGFFVLKEKLIEISILLSFLLFFINTELCGVENQKGLLFKYIYSSVIYIISKIIGIFHFLVELLSSFLNIFRKNKVNGKNILVFLLVFIFSIPIFIIVIGLLSQTNSFFADIFKSLTINFNRDYSNLYTFIIIFVLTIGDIFFIRYLNKITQSLNNTRFKIDPNIINLLTYSFSIILFILNVIYIIFIFTEIKYDFGNLRELVLNENLPNYSRLATDRFWELTIVSFINLSFLYFLTKPITGIVNKNRFSFLKINYFITLFSTIFLCISSNQRLVFYEQGYGFTPLRIISHSFVFVVAFICILYIFPILKKELITRVNKLTIIVLLMFLSLITILPLSYISNRVNVDLYNTNRIKVFDVENNQLYYDRFSVSSSENYLSQIYYYSNSRLTEGQKLNFEKGLLKNIKSDVSELEKFPIYRKSILDLMLEREVRNLNK